MCRSKTKPIEALKESHKLAQDKIGTIEVVLNQLKRETSQYIKQLEIRINTIDHCLKSIQDENIKRDNVLNKVVGFINENFVEHTVLGCYAVESNQDQKYNYQGTNTNSYQSSQKN